MAELQDLFLSEYRQSVFTFTYEQIICLVDAIAKRKKRQNTINEPDDLSAGDTRDIDEQMKIGMLKGLPIKTNR